MKIKIAHLLAASVLMSSSFLCAAVNAQSAPPLGSDQGAGTTPQSAPDFSGGRHRGGRGDGGAGGGEMSEQRRQRMMERFDANHDGTLDDSERAQMKAAREQKMQQMGGGRGGNRMGMDGAGGGPGGRMGGLGGNMGQQGGNGMGGGQGLGGPGLGGPGMGGGMSDEQRQERKKRMLDRFDANHDGQLDDSERNQMKEQFGKMRQGGGGGRRGRFGGGGDWSRHVRPGSGTDAGASGGGFPPVNGPGGAN